MSRHKQNKCQDNDITGDKAGYYMMRKENFTRS